MSVYLDTCSIQRPLDDKTQVRIILEAESILGIIDLCEEGQIDLISSEVLVFEIRRNPQPICREYGITVLNLAEEFVNLEDDIEKRAKQFTKIGIKALDALHLASAEAGGADYFCTCDDKFLRKAKGIVDLRTKAVSPVALIEEIEK